MPTRYDGSSTAARPVRLDYLETERGRDLGDRDSRLRREHAEHDAAAVLDDGQAAVAQEPDRDATGSLPRTSVAWGTRRPVMQREAGTTRLRMQRPRGPRRPPNVAARRDVPARRRLPGGGIENDDVENPRVVNTGAAIAREGDRHQ